ncbi:tumor necrosis factor receptor superfamily member 6-like [Ruditapes philippinarum]|uniref:tumor necrosis factor receptor superfamily member 6-like n=1 Tax=Ruditapes philippinarum TaxID=129788 RepID=UPI00295ABDB3|nr:tumor necrosis factor receptor superfamily member 6-like [Ruditapes philippinarum]
MGLDYLGPIILVTCLNTFFGASVPCNETYLAKNGHRCYPCCVGYHKVSDCDIDGEQFRCKPCRYGYYMPTCDNSTQCKKCDQFCHGRQIEIKACTSTSNLKCQCKDGYYWKKDPHRFCTRHSKCIPGEGLKTKDVGGIPWVVVIIVISVSLSIVMVAGGAGVKLCVGRSKRIEKLSSCQEGEDGIHKASTENQKLLKTIIVAAAINGVTEDISQATDSSFQRDEIRSIHSQTNSGTTDMEEKSSEKFEQEHISDKPDSKKHSLFVDCKSGKESQVANGTSNMDSPPLYESEDLSGVTYRQVQPVPVSLESDRQDETETTGTEDTNTIYSAGSRLSTSIQPV